MEYAAMTFWLLVIVFAAMGVHQLWSSLIQPKVVNSILLPGTLVAQIGYMLGVLITGGTVNNTALIKDDDSGEPQTGTEEKPKVPLVGTILIALLPMIGCAAAIYWSARYFGESVLAGMEKSTLQQVALPTTIPHFFDLLRASVTLVENLVIVVRAQDLGDWQQLLFLYLAICLTVRMAPLTGNVRGSLGAIFISGVLMYLLGRIMQTGTGPFGTAWPLITFSVAVLLFLLIVSLLLRALVSLIKTVSGQG